MFLIAKHICASCFWIPLFTISVQFRRHLILFLSFVFYGQALLLRSGQRSEMERWRKSATEIHVWVTQFPWPSLEVWRMTEIETWKHFSEPKTIHRQSKSEMESCGRRRWWQIAGGTRTLIGKWCKSRADLIDDISPIKEAGYWHANGKLKHNTLIRRQIKIALEILLKLDLLTYSLTTPKCPKYIHYLFAFMKIWI